MDKNESDLGGGGEENERDVDMNRDDDGDGILEQKNRREFVHSDGQEEDGCCCRDGVERDGSGDGRHGGEKQYIVGNRGRGETIDDEEQNGLLRERAARMRAQRGKPTDESEVTPLVGAARGMAVAIASIVTKFSSVAPTLSKRFANASVPTSGSVTKSWN